MICHINLAKGYRGGERQTEILIKELANKGFNQTIFVRKNSALTQKLNGVINLQVIEINKPFIINIFKFKNCAIIHAHEKKAEQLALIINLFFKKPYFITRRVLSTPKKHLFNNLIYKNAIKVFTLSSIIDKIMNDNFKLNTQIIPSVSSKLKTTTKLNDLKKKYRNYFIITNIGALVNKDKGQEYIIKAANLLKHNHKLKFLIIGEGKDKEYYNTLIKKYNLSNIELIGFKNNIGDYLKISDIFLFPSLNEGLGSILIDAMEYGKPIIATNIGGIPDLIKNNYNGILIPAKDEISIEKEIQRLYKDSKLRDTLSFNAKKESSKYHMNILIDKYIKNYTDIIKNQESNK